MAEDSSEHASPTPDMQYEALQGDPAVRAEGIGGMVVESTKAEGAAAMEQGSESWEQDKAHTIGNAVNESLYSPNHLSEQGIKGHPAEKEFNQIETDRFEQLYNLNPDHFGQMPTAEFINANREWHRINAQLRQAQSDFAKAQKNKQEF